MDDLALRTWELRLVGVRPLTVNAVAGMHDKTPQDPGACAPEFKASLDGLVDAKVLPDDGPEFVESIVFLPPLIGQGDGLLVRIVEVA